MSRLAAALCLALSLLNANQAAWVRPTPDICPNITSIPIDVARFSGTWFEGARQQLVSYPYACVQLHFAQLGATDILSIQSNYSYADNQPWSSHYLLGMAQLPNNTASPSGFGAFVVQNDKSFQPWTTYKILATDYINFAYLCGYTNAADESTWFYTILTRDRFSIDQMADAIVADDKYNSILDKNLAVVMQNATCWTPPKKGLQ